MGTSEELLALADAHIEIARADVEVSADSTPEWRLSAGALAGAHAQIAQALIARAATITEQVAAPRFALVLDDDEGPT